MRRPNIVLFSVDCLRSDFLGLRAENMDTMPFTRELAKASAVFVNCITAADGTDPSIASILTSNYPPVHGQTQNGAFFDPKAIPTLPEQLRTAGYRTCAAVGVEHLDGHFGYSRGFDAYFDSSPWDRVFHAVMNARGIPRRLRRSAARLNRSQRFGGHSAQGRVVAARASQWLERNRSKPFFLWVHFFDAHNHRLKIQAYAELLNQVDGFIRDIVEQIRAAELEEDTYFVMTSDHGESFGEHGYLTHGMRLHDEVIRVPLIISGPQVRACTLSAQVRTIDIAPTVCHLAEAPIPHSWRGESLWPWIKGERVEDLDALSYGACPYRTSTKSIRTKTWKYIIYLHVDHRLGEKYTVPREERSRIPGFNDGSIDELYNLEDDPAEQRNLIHECPEKVYELQARFFQLENLRSPAYNIIDEENVVGMLSALGYM